MKLKIVLFANLLCLPVMAQRDFRLTEQRNAWLTSGNAATLTMFADSTIAHASLSFGYGGGARRDMTDGKQKDAYAADVRSYVRLTPAIVAYGRAAYSNSGVSDAAGSMLFKTRELMPFDLVEETADNTGDKRTETFGIDGAIGWNAWRNVSVGARLNYTAGTYAKHRDLRHSNTLMCLDARTGFFVALPEGSGIGAALVYRRRTETMRFKTYGTTDRIYTTLIDYANGYGERETFGTEGFTDSNSELPLLSEYVEFTAQGAYRRLFADIAYTRRTGYYGRKSQYSASHERHHGDVFSMRLRHDMARNRQRLLWMEIDMTTERITAERENYRRTTATNGTAAVYYEYAEPTKMADKAQTYGTVTMNAYWKPDGDIFLWQLKGGVDGWTRRQTAYVYPDIHTTSPHIVAPFIEAKRCVLTRGRSLLSAQARCSVAMGSERAQAAHVAVGYEMPLHGTSLRPGLQLAYDMCHTPFATTHAVTIKAVATF